MTRILACIDGSAYAESVCDHAAWTAGRLHGRVTLLHMLGRHNVASAPVNLSGMLDFGGRSALLEELSELDQKAAKVAQKRGRLILTEGVKRLQANGVADVAERLRHGDVTDAMAEVEAETDLIIIGKRGEAAEFARDHLGSNLERVVRALSKPILVAPRQFRPIERVLVAHDGGASIDKAMNHMAGSPLFQGLACELFTVGSSGAQLKTAAERLRGNGMAVSIAAAEGDADELISARVAETRADLLVMGAYGHSRIRNLVIGSTTTAVLLSTHVPVLLFR